MTRKVASGPLVWNHPFGSLQATVGRGSVSIWPGVGLVTCVSLLPWIEVRMMLVGWKQRGEDPERAKAQEPNAVGAPRIAQQDAPGLLEPGFVVVAGLNEGLRPLRRHSSTTDPLGGTQVPGSMSRALRQREGNGARLPAAVADPMGQALGIDTSALRVHADPQAGSIADSVQAEAFTYGNDIYFAPGRYEPTSQTGRRVLAHELSHVAARRSGADSGTAGPLSVGRADDPAEVAADRSAERVIGALRRSPNPAAAHPAGPDADILAGRPTGPDPALMIRRMARAAVKDNIEVRISDRIVVHDWWIEQDTTGVVVDSSGDADVSVKLTTGKYAGETVKIGSRYFEPVTAQKDPAESQEAERPVKPVEVQKPVLSLGAQLEDAFDNGAKPTIEELQKIIQPATAPERKQVADDRAFLDRAKAALDEDTYLGLLPAIGVYEKPSTPTLREGGKAHTTATDADKAIREYLQQYLAKAVKEGRKVEGEVSVVGEEDFQMAFDRQWVRAAGLSFGKKKASEVCNAFVDVNLPKRHIWVNRNLGNTGTVIHEGMHKYADDILRDEQIALCKTLKIAHGGISPLDEGITEYFTRIVTKQLGMADRSNYANEFPVAEMLAGKIGEKALASAYYDGQLDAMRKPFGKDWATFAEKIERKDWKWLWKASNWV